MSARACIGDASVGIDVSPYYYSLTLIFKIQMICLADDVVGVICYVAAHIRLDHASSGWLEADELLASPGTAQHD